MYSLPGGRDPIRNKLYRSFTNRPTAAERKAATVKLKERLTAFQYQGEPLPAELSLTRDKPVVDYFRQFPGLDAGDRYNNAGFWNLPIPVTVDVDVHPDDVVIYDSEGYEPLKKFLNDNGVRHVLLTGYATDMCFCRTTAGYENLSKDFNVFLVGDASLATFPANISPRFAVNAAISFAALNQLVTQVSWVELDRKGPWRLAQVAEVVRLQSLRRPPESPNSSEIGYDGCPDEGCWRALPSVSSALKSISGVTMCRRAWLRRSAAAGIAGLASLSAHNRGLRAAEPDKALIAITLDLEMSRNFPTWETTHWDYEKGNLNEQTKQYAVEAARRVRAAGGVLHFFAVGRVFEQENVEWLKQVVDQGHPIGNHTYDHVNVTAERIPDVQYRFQRSPWLADRMTPAEVIRNNIRLCDLAMQRRLGIKADGFRTPRWFCSWTTRSSCGAGDVTRPGVQLGQQSLSATSELGADGEAQPSCAGRHRCRAGGCAAFHLP